MRKRTPATKTVTYASATVARFSMMSAWRSAASSWCRSYCAWRKEVSDWPLCRTLERFSENVFIFSLGVRRETCWSEEMTSRPNRSISRTAMEISLDISP